MYFFQLFFQIPLLILFIISQSSLFHTSQYHYPYPLVVYRAYPLVVYILELLADGPAGEHAEHADDAPVRARGRRAGGAVAREPRQTRDSGRGH